MWISEEEREEQAQAWNRYRDWKRGGKRNRRKAQKQKRKEGLRLERQQAEKRARGYLKIFWECFNQAGTDERKLAILKAAANPGWARVSKELRLTLRKEFQRKYAWFLNVPIEKCGSCDQKPKEKHHIVPLSHGGINEDVNLIAICTDCHDAIHPWMRA